MITNLYIKCFKNNTIITVTSKNKTLKTMTSGYLGFKGAKRSTRHATQEILKTIQNFLLLKKLYNINIFIEGFGKGRTIVLKTLKHPSITFLKFIEISKIKHNGCRLKKKRRI